MTRVKTESNGSAKDVKCPENHSGNRRFFKIGKDIEYWECVGCGLILSTVDVMERQSQKRK